MWARARFRKLVSFLNLRSSSETRGNPSIGDVEADGARMVVMAAFGRIGTTPQNNGKLE